MNVSNPLAVHIESGAQPFISRSSTVPDTLAEKKTSLLVHTQTHTHTLMWTEMFTFDGSRHAPAFCGTVPQNGAAALRVGAGLTFKSCTCEEGQSGNFVWYVKSIQNLAMKNKVIII